MSTIRELIEAVEAGTFSHVDWSWGRFPVGLSFDQVAAAYNGSMDAALALMAAVLPGWIWGRQVKGAVWVAKRPNIIRVMPLQMPIARALLLAILKAVEAQR